MSEKNIYQRMAGVMKDVPYIKKDDKVNFKGTSYTYVSHDKVTSKIQPAFLKHGVGCNSSVVEHKCNGNRCEILLRVQFVNIDNPSDFIEVHSLGYGIDTQDKGPGKATSYAFKYACLKTLCLETGDDPEKDQIDHVPEPAQKVKEHQERIRKMVVAFAADSHKVSTKDLANYLQRSIDTITEEDILILQGLYQSMNKGKTWTELTNPPAAEPDPQGKLPL